MRKLHTFDEVMDGQKGFRMILDAMANPAREEDFAPLAEKLYGEHPAFLAAAMILLDGRVSFSACGDEELAGQIRLLTQAKEVSVAEADYIFSTGDTSLEGILEQAKEGTLSDPHSSATILVEDRGEETFGKNFYGPGIDGTIQKRVSERIRKLLKLRDMQEYEYPKGIDLLIFSEQEKLWAVPRTAREEK